MRFPLILGLVALAMQHPAPAKADCQADKLTASRVFLEKLGRGDLSKLEQIYDPAFVAHSGGQSYSLEYDNASTLAIRTAVPDLSVSVNKLVAEGDQVAVYWSAKGTNTVAAAGLPGQGKRGSIEGMTIFRFSKGRIVEEWSVTDMLSALRQLGALP